MGSFRVARTEEDIKREITKIIPTLKDYRIDGIITVVKVELSSDLSYCKVYISCLGGSSSTKKIIEGLESGCGYIKKEIAVRIKMKKMPSFMFIEDKSLEYASKINKIIDKLV